MEHHKLGPSKFPAWEECLCYSSSDRETDDSRSGTDAHAELNRALTDRNYVPSDPAVSWALKWIETEADGATVESEVRLTGSVGVLKGIFGTADVLWEKDGVLHIADFKRFSDGTTNYLRQLMGYAALSLVGDSPLGGKVCLHILHGGVFKAETVETTNKECYNKTVALLKRVMKGGEPRICKWCQWCGRASECSATSHAVDVVQNNLPSFARLSLCQKLVVLDAVDKLSKSLRDEAKKQAVENGGFIEMDGIRYEMKPWAGASKCRDIREVADAMRSPFVEHRLRGDISEHMQVEGLTPAELLAACSLSKTSLVAKMKEKNKGACATKADFERWAEQFFDKTEGSPHFVRVL